ncbi:hypothetical protein [Streptomyces sp. NPDC088726]|uniref:hypothetical protein n=1 Tax=Streptomyces sp. NPDC088726 TaxID=3365874 RepID=UPI003822AD83
MTEPTRAQLLHLAARARDGRALPAEHDALAAGITAVYLRLATAERVAQSAARDAADALTRQLAAEQRAELHREQPTA